MTKTQDHLAPVCVPVLHTSFLVSVKASRCPSEPPECLIVSHCVFDWLDALTVIPLSTEKGRRCLDRTYVHMEPHHTTHTHHERIEPRHVCLALSTSHVLSAVQCNRCRQGSTYSSLSPRPAKKRPNAPRPMKREGALLVVKTIDR